MQVKSDRSSVGLLCCETDGKCFGTAEEEEGIEGGETAADGVDGECELLNKTKINECGAERSRPQLTLAKSSRSVQTTPAIKS